MPTITIEREGRRVVEAELVSGAAIGSALPGTAGSLAGCAIVLADLAGVHARVRFPDLGDDVALYLLAPDASVRIAGVEQRGRVRLWAPECTFELGAYVVTLRGLPVLPPLDVAIDEKLTAGPSYRSLDDIERDLVASLRERPSDHAMREVYADWLEEHGATTRAELLRSAAGAGHCELAPRDELAWRVVVSRAPIERCVAFRGTCSRWWSELEATDDDRVRRCTTCAREVYYCASVDEARLRGRRRESIAIDAGVPRDAALTAYDGLEGGPGGMRACLVDNDGFDGDEPTGTWFRPGEPG